MITYPLQMPQTAPGPKSLVIAGNVIVGESSSPFTAQQQEYEFQGSWWELQVIMPLMTRAQAEPWLSFLLALNGRLGTFLAGDPNAQPLGTAGGTPIVCGIIPNGKVFYIVGLTGTLKAGDFFQVFDGQKTRLFKNLTDQTPPVVNTTIAASFAAGSQVVTPASMVNITAGAALASDTFARADGSPGVNWTQVGGSVYAINTNRIECTTGNGPMAYTAIAWPNDQFSEAAIQNITSNQEFSVGVRLSSTVDTGYYLYQFGTQWRMRRSLAGVHADIWTGNGTYVVGDIIRIEVQGTTVTFKRNGAVIASVTDPNIASGSAGFYCPAGAGLAAGTGNMYNNWRGGDMSSPGTALAIDTGSSLELVQVTGITATTFTATFANAHTGPVTVRGANVLDVFPRVRNAPANGAAIQLALPQGTFRLKDNSVQYSVDEAKLYTVTFAAKEAS